MTIRALTFAGAFAALFLSGAVAQQNQPAQSPIQQPMGGGQMPMTQMSAGNLPEGCRTAAQSSGHGQMMQGMMGSMQSQMQGMMANMPEAQKAYMEAMMRIQGPMMAGSMAKDPDVAFVCGMIAHHQGAIDMARIELEHGNNAEAQRMAEKVVEDQGEEIRAMTAWVERNAARESQGETTGSTRK